MPFMQIDDIGIPASEEQANGEQVTAPAFPLPVVMLFFLVAGYFMLRQVWNSQ